MSMRMSELSGSAFSTPTRNRYSVNFGSSNGNNQNQKSNGMLSTDVLYNTLSSSMQKQTTQSELFDIELEDSDFYKADRALEEINMLAAKSYAYSKNSGLTGFKSSKAQDEYMDSNEPRVGFVPIKPTPTKNRTPKYNKYDLSGKSYFSEPHIYPRKPQKEAYQDTTYTDEGVPFGNFEFFRATPVRKPPSLI